MSYPVYYKKGDWKAICDVCGRLYKASRLQLRWDNLMVCPQDWETRQPQDFVRGIPDYQNTPWARTEQADNFLIIDFLFSSRQINGGPLNSVTIG